MIKVIISVQNFLIPAFLSHHKSNCYQVIARTHQSPSDCHFLTYQKNVHQRKSDAHPAYQ